MANGNVIELIFRGVDEITDVTKKISSAMDNTAARIGIAATAATAAAVAFHKFVDGTLAQAEAAQKAAQKIDMEVDAYQRMAASMKLANVEEGAMTAGIRRMSMVLAEAEDKTSKQAKLLAELGITAKTPQQAISQLADVMQNATGTTGKMAIGQELLGRGFQELLPWLKQGSAAHEEQGKQAERLGSIMNNSLVAAADNARDNMELLTGVLTNIKNNAVLPLAPALEQASGKWVKFAENSQAVKAITLAINGALTVSMKLLAAFGDIALTVAEVFGTSFKVVGSVIGGVGAAIAALLRGELEQAGDIVKTTFKDAGDTVASSKEALAAIWVRTDAAIAESSQKVAVNLDVVHKTLKDKEVAEKAATEAAKEHEAALKRLQSAEDSRLKSLGEVMSSLQKESEQAAVGDEVNKKWIGTLEKLRSLNASDEVIAVAKGISDSTFAAERNNQVIQNSIALMDQRAAAISANLGPMERFAETQAIINGQVEQGLMTQEVANQKLWEADIAMKQATSSAAYLTATNATAMESFQAMAIAQLESLGSISVQVGDLMLNAMNTMVAGVSNAIATAIVMGTSLSDLMKRVLQQVAIQVLSTLIQIGIQRVILAGIYQAMNIKDATSSLSSGAAKVYINAFASTAAIPMIGPALAPGVAAASLAAALAGSAAAGAAGAGMGAGVGAAHGGLGYVPEESTYLLAAGERVLSPRQNRDLTDFMEGGGGGGGGSIGTVNIHILENATNAEVFARMNQVELREALGQPVIDALNSMFRIGVKPEFASVAS